MSGLKGIHVNSPCDECAGTILLNRVGGRISPKKKGERGVSMNCKIRGVKGKRGLGAPGGGGGGGETVKQRFERGLKETYIRVHEKHHLEIMNDLPV